MKHSIFVALVSIWKILPFKVFHARILKTFPKILGKLYKDLRFKGEMTVKLEDKSFKLYNPGFTTIENEIFWFGLENGWEKVSLKLWIELVKHSNTVLDIGANTGVYSLVAATINPNAEVFAFEPVQRKASIFNSNLELNPTLNIKLFELAVSNDNGTATFYDLPTSSQYSASLNKDMLASFTNRISYDVTVVKLDDLKELKNKKIDLIKLDVEMHEPEAIEGMIELVKRHKPFILIEILTNDIGSKIQEIFSALNYSYFNIDEINIPRKVEVLTASDHYNFLFVPASKQLDFDFLNK